MIKEKKLMWLRYLKNIFPQLNEKTSWVAVSTPRVRILKERSDPICGLRPAYELKAGLKGKACRIFGEIFGSEKIREKGYFAHVPDYKEDYEDIYLEKYFVHGESITCAYFPDEDKLFVYEEKE